MDRKEDKCQAGFNFTQRPLVSRSGRGGVVIATNTKKGKSWRNISRRERGGLRKDRKG